MITNLIDELVTRIASTVKSDQAQSENQIDKSKLKALLSSAVRKIDMVPRDEFDAQARVLLRTREKLEKLENKLNLLEESLKK